MAKNITHLVNGASSHLIASIKDAERKKPSFRDYATNLLQNSAEYVKFMSSGYNPESTHLAIKEYPIQELTGRMLREANSSSYVKPYNILDLLDDAKEHLRYAMDITKENEKDKNKEKRGEFLRTAESIDSRLAGEYLTIEEALHELNYYVAQNKKQGTGLYEKVA